MREEWRYAWVISGALFVISAGAVRMPLLYVVNWDIPQQVDTMMVEVL